MTNLITTPAYRVAFSMYVAIGGDPNRVFSSVAEIYDAIDVLYGQTTTVVNINPLDVSVTENNTYTYAEEGVTGYKPVTFNVDVPQKYTDEQVESLKDTARQEGYNSGYDTGVGVGFADGYSQGETDGYSDGYAEGLDDGAEDQKALLGSVTFSLNGNYKSENGWNDVTVAVPGGASSTPKIYNGFQFTGGDISKIDFSQYDWSNVYDTDYFFENCTNSTNDWSNFLENYNGKFLSCYRMFYGCASLKTVPLFDTSNVTTMGYMFYNCHDLTAVPLFNTSNVISMSNMLAYCPSLTSVPLFDTSNVTDMSHTFNTCAKLTSVPLFDTSNVTNMTNMFRDCTLLTSVPLFDTSNVTDMSYMFSGCKKLTPVPLFDTSNVTIMNSMLQDCTLLTSVPLFDTSNVTNMGYMCNGCSKLTTFPMLDCSSVTNMGAMLQSCSLLTTLGGFKDLGKQRSLSGTDTMLRNCISLTYESAMNVINNLYDRKTAGYSVLTLKFHANVLALLSDDDIAIATNKGWTISSY